jgi:hypothetical protein
MGKAQQLYLVFLEQDVMRIGQLEALQLLLLLPFHLEFLEFAL